MEVYVFSYIAVSFFSVPCGLERKALVSEEGEGGIGVALLVMTGLQCKLLFADSAHFIHSQIQTRDT